MMRSFSSSTSKLRILLDLTWVAAFVAVMVLLYGSGKGRAALDKSIQLEMPLGGQTRGIFLRGHRVGQIEQDIERHRKGWRITQRFVARVGKERVDVGWSRLVLRKDLSLQTVAVSADPGRLAELLGVAGKLTKLLKVGKLKIHGTCVLPSGRCNVQGRVGDRRVEESVLVGRGPVVPSALFPLLVRGVLGKRTELVVFDPMSLTRKLVVYRIIGPEVVQVRGRSMKSIRVEQDVQGMFSSLWLDERGRVLKEQLPMGLRVEHEAWR